MKTKLHLLFPVMALVLIAGFNTNPSDNRYIRAKVCSACHSGDSVNNIYEKWQASAHSKAFQTLKTPKAKEIAKKLNIKNPHESSQCIKCHVTNGGAAKNIDFEEGVSCEACHGPGSGYMMRDIMSNPEISKKKGLIIRRNDPGFCKSCHNPESPTYKEFNYASAWEKIKHPKK